MHVQKLDPHMQASACRLRRVHIQEHPQRVGRAGGLGSLALHGYQGLPDVPLGHGIGTSAGR